MNTSDPPPSVLVVDDDPAVRTALERALSLHRFDVTSVATGAAAVERAVEVQIMVLDVGLPDIDGVEVARRLREQGLVLPILVLSARSEVDDRVAGLQAGADDYLIKPFAVAELVERLRALLRRHDRQVVRTTTADGDPHSSGGRHEDPAVLVYADVTVDPRRRMATRGDLRLDLTLREFDLLETLVRNGGIVLSRTQLLSEVWGYDFEVGSNVVDVFVGYLRRKLEAGDRPRILQTVRGIGFVLRDDP